uniref:Uncharacterized protein n=1 Tax=Anguilla anguilla TaxID=7936 RepID=A0A0E9WW63_ANGAN
MYLSKEYTYEGQGNEMIIIPFIYITNYKCSFHGSAFHIMPHHICQCLTWWDSK